MRAQRRRRPSAALGNEFRARVDVRAPEGAGAEWVEAEGQEVSALVHDLVTEAGGSISAEHGIGQMKLHELVRLGGAARIHALQAVKRGLDPHWIMNPGKLVPLP